VRDAAEVAGAVIPAPRIQVLDSGANPLSVLRGYTSVTVSQTFCDLGSLQLSFPKDMAGAVPLLSDEDRYLKVVYPGAPEQWFLVDEDSFSFVDDAPEQGGWQVTCRSFAGVLDEAFVLPSGGIGTTPATYPFTAPKPGQIMVSLVNQSQAQGWLPGLTLDGGNTNDADGAAWAAMPDTTYSLGTSHLAVLKGLSDAQLMEWQFAGRTLEMYVPGGGLDRTLGLTIRPGHDVVSAPVQRSRRGIATDVVVEGAAGASFKRSQVLAGRRPRGVYVSQTSAPSGSLNTIARYYLEAHAAPDVQATHELADGDDAPVPFVDYRPGDRIGTAALGGGVVSRRIVQVAVTHDDSGAHPSLEVGSILQAAEDKFARKLARLNLGGDSLT
jgi:hypothetical protein